MVLRITNLKDLKKWNRKPTKEKPIVMEWFYDWFFIKVLEKDNYELAEEAYNTAVDFTEKCEKLTYAEAVGRMQGNLRYYSGYSATWVKKYGNFLKVLAKNNENKQENTQTE